MEISRRAAIKQTLGGLACSVLYGCGRGGGGSGSKKNNGPNPPRRKIEGLDYFLDGTVTREGLEIVEIEDSLSGKKYQIQCQEPSYRGDISLALSRQESSKNLLLVASDTRDEYFPSARIINSGESSPLDLTTIALNHIKNGISLPGLEAIVRRQSEIITNYNLLREGKNPPGLVYLGKVSFNDLKEFSGAAKKYTGLLAFAVPTPITLKIYGIASTVDTIFGTLDHAIDIINYAFGERIDKDKEYAIYIETNINQGGLNFFFFPIIYILPADAHKGYDADIEDLLPTKEGVFWSLKRNKGELRMDVMKMKNGLFGRDHIGIGSKENYTAFAYEKGELLKLGSIRNGSINRKYSPPLVVGSKGMGVGWFRYFKSKVTPPIKLFGSEEFEVEIEGRLEVVDRVQDKFGKFLFGDAFVLNENRTTRYYQKNTGRGFITKATDTIRLVENLGYATLKTVLGEFVLEKYGIDLPLDKSSNQVEFIHPDIGFDEELRIISERFR